jgi:hypothetical protein
MFVDFRGGRICFHPEVVMVEDVRRETQLVESLALGEFASVQSRSETAFSGAPMVAGV